MYDYDWLWIEPYIEWGVVKGCDHYNEIVFNGLIRGPLRGVQGV